MNARAFLAAFLLGLAWLTALAALYGQAQHDRDALEWTR